MTVSFKKNITYFWEKKLNEHIFLKIKMLFKKTGFPENIFCLLAFLRTRVRLITDFLRRAFRFPGTPLISTFAFGPPFTE